MATTRAREVTTCKVYCPDSEGLIGDPGGSSSWLESVWTQISVPWYSEGQGRAGKGRLWGGQVLCPLDLSCGKRDGQRKNGETPLASRAQGGHCCLGPKGDTVYA